MNRVTSKLAAILISLTAAAASAHAGTWIVATNGNDAGSGTLASPFRTITKAASVARAGDQVQVRGGVYQEIVKISSKGTASAPIVFQSYPGERAIIDGTGSASNTNLVQISGAEYVDFVNFEVRNSTRIGICGWGGRNVRLLSNTIHSSIKGGIWFGYSSIGYTSDILIEGNAVHNNVLENQYHTSTTGWSQAIGLQNTERVTVTNNRVFRNDGEGIAFILSNNGVARRNEVFDNYAVNVYLDNARYTQVDSNLVYSTGDTRYYRGGYPAHGIGMANEAYSTTNPLTDLAITNNIVVNGRWSIYYGNYENGGGLKNTLIANNTLYNASHALLNIDSSAHSNSRVLNNVFVQVGGGYGATVAGGGVTYASNAWYGAGGGAASGSGDFIGDPRLVNAGGLKAEDYRLTSGSPVLQMGSAAVSNDYWNAVRPANVDLGAHQLSSDSTTTAPAPAPTPAPAMSLHVAKIAIDYSQKGKNHTYRPRVTVVDQNGTVVAGVSVTGTWSGALSGTRSGTTQTDGIATLSTEKTSNTGAVTFTVTGLAKDGYTFSSSDSKSVTTTRASVE